jgi:hypothetical protein
LSAGSRALADDAAVADADANVERAHKLFQAARDASDTARWASTSVRLQHAEAGEYLAESRARAMNVERLALASLEAARGAREAARDERDAFL